MTGWSSKPEWPDLSDKDKTQVKELWDSVVASATVPEGVFSGIDLGAGDSQTILTTFEDGKFTHKVIPPEELYLKEKYNNKMPTHDPYTNPNAQLYHECQCGAILDPGTKSFASLNTHASNAGWKIRWKSNGDGYQAFCVECGKDLPE